MYKHRWESQKCQKRATDNFDNDKYVYEGENSYGRVKTHFYMLSKILVFFMGYFFAIFGMECFLWGTPLSIFQYFIR